jgi:sn-glycerol 3-phosphate transport system ATP-binding protein
LAEVEFRDVTRSYPGGRSGDTVALKGLNLTVSDGEFLILVGPSGCGKSTALRLLAGLDKPTSGEIRIGGTVVNGLSPGERDIAMVFQNYALYPHMSVYRNLAYGLRQRRTPRAEVERRVRETASLLEIDELLDRKPGQLSGGQRQRVAMGRALVRQPQAFLLDEPLSNLDAKLRNQVRGDLKRLHRELPVTSIYVTHDQVEAMTLGDRLCVMSDGEVQQIGTTDDIYNRPANTFVAAFMGSPPMNLMPGMVRSGVLHIGGVAVTTASEPDGPVTVGARPEHLRLDTSPSDGMVPARVDFTEPLGSHVLVTALVDPSPDGSLAPGETRVIVQAPSGTELESGTRIGLQLPPERTYFFDAETGDARHSREQSLTRR